MSYNRPLNFIIGARSNGKTYAFKEYCISDFIDSNYVNQFVWVRRYKTELFGDKGSKDLGLNRNFFADIEHAEKFKGHEFKTRGSVIYIDGKIAGYFIALSVSQMIKSVAFPYVNKIIYDEFVIDDRGCYKYLPNEVTTMNELISTVFRSRPVKVYFIGNAITFANPYFLYYNIKPFDGEFYKNDGIVVQFCKKVEILEDIANTQYGKFIAGTKYGKYNLDNKMMLDSNNFIAKKVSTARYMCAMKYDNEIYGFSYDKNSDLIYVDNTFDKTGLIYSIDVASHDENSFLIKASKYTHLDTIKSYFYLGKIRFENIMIKTKCIEFIASYFR